MLLLAHVSPLPATFSSLSPLSPPHAPAPANANSRVRKLRCDGAQPTCYNCNKARDKGVKCAYPSAPPKRRGADKGQRIRSPIGQRQPRKAAPIGVVKRRRERENGGGDFGTSGDSATEASSSVPGTPDDSI